MVLTTSNITLSATFFNLMIFQDCMIHILSISRNCIYYSEFAGALVILPVDISSEPANTQNFAAVLSTCTMWLSPMVLLEKISILFYRTQNCPMFPLLLPAVQVRFDMFCHYSVNIFLSNTKSIFVRCQRFLTDFRSEHWGTFLGKANFGYIFREFSPRKR